MTFADRKKYFNICDPYRYAKMGSDEFVDLDGMKVRGRDWSQDKRLVACFESRFFLYFGPSIAYECYEK